MMHHQLEEYCISKKLFNKGIQKQFDWKSVMTFSSGKEKDLEPTGREKRGLEFLEEHFGGCFACNGKDNNLDSVANKTPINFAFDGMSQILRDTEICMHGGFQTTGSQISILSSVDSSKNNIHLFTSYNPDISVYKPFLFSSNESEDKHCDSKTPSNHMSEKTKCLWVKHHAMNRRNRTTIRDRLLGKEKQFLDEIEGSIQHDQQFGGKNCFEEYVDKEMNILESL